MAAPLPSTSPVQELPGSCQSSHVTNLEQKKKKGGGGESGGRGGRYDGGSNGVSDWRWLITGGRFAVLLVQPLLAAKLTKPQCGTAGNGSH